MKTSASKLTEEKSVSKVCYKCKEEKELEEFHFSSLKNQNYLCRSCLLIKSINYYCNNKEKLRAKTREYYKNNKEKVNARNRKNYNKEKTRERYLERKYGLSLAKYNMILEEQEGKCFICKRTSKQIRNSKKRTFHVDHCHTTGRIRGLLCNNCNMNILPLIEKKLFMIDNLKEYLTRETNYGYIPEKSN